MTDPIVAHLLGSLLLAFFTGTAQPAPADLVAAAPQPVVLDAWWHPLDRAGNEQDLLIIGPDGTVFAGATSSAVSPPKNLPASGS